jgi:hypothetical protein
MSEELKKEWVESFEQDFEMKNFALYSKKHDMPATTNEIKELISFLLAKQQEEISQRITEQYKQNPPYLDASSWWNYGLKMTFAQYFLEKQQEEFVKKIQKAMPSHDAVQRTLDDLLADIKSKLNNDCPICGRKDGHIMPIKNK